MNYTYEKHFVSKREDGRIASSLAAWMEYLRRSTPKLAVPENLTEESFRTWKAKVRAKLEDLLNLPEREEQPLPVLVSSVQREGYRTEKWEFYPYETAVVPVLMQIPDSVSEESPAPIVFCFPGFIQTKELVTGEPLLDEAAARLENYPERSRMGKHIVENGMISVSFDPVCIGETSFLEDNGDFGIKCRDELTYGLLEYGYNFPGLSVFQALCFIDFCKTLPFVDGERIGLCAHSLGTETALPIAILRDDIKAFIFNDFLCDQLRRYVAITETDQDFSDRGSLLEHILPGKFRYFCYPDLCAALAPAYLALNEGGAEEELDKVRKTYAALGLSDRLSVTYYPHFAEKKDRPHNDEAVPKFGLSPETYFEYTGTYAPDHSFRKEPSIRLLKKCFGLD